ncbi:myophilin-like isoform X2 [Paramacrobiotus metropolitanus]|uniref:myophilin-like isoform X2 n=1 Tax=Paramacrobiotus metropolitanus TaxID=2943436 RepID=UPI0024459A4C|nr:myophilin-like isoform X2 [Paramacrobiotus metropolitanus]
MTSSHSARLAPNIKMKLQRKYDETRAEEALAWINDVLGPGSVNTSGKAEDFYEALKDGVVLCNLANALQPGSVKKVETSKMAFKCMENINNFTRAATAMGVPTPELFQSVDLWERQNLNAVVICLESLGRKASKFGKPGIGPKEADKNVRNFTDEQLRASDGMISLQYGSNKGANQHGINMGNTRHM